MSQFQVGGFREVRKARFNAVSRRDIQGRLDLSKALSFPDEVHNLRAPAFCLLKLLSKEGLGDRLMMARDIDVGFQLKSPLDRRNPAKGRAMLFQMDDGVMSARGNKVSYECEPRTR